MILRQRALLNQQSVRAVEYKDGNSAVENSLLMRGKFFFDTQLCIVCIDKDYLLLDI